MTTKTRFASTFGGISGLHRSAGIRVGIIGAGFIGEVHARAVRATGAQLVAVTDGTPGGSEEAALRLGAASSVVGAEEMMEMAELDVVHICTPNYLHAPMARMAIEAGKHVVCEKPLATTRARAEELVGLAEAAGLVTGVPLVYRYYPTVQEARSRVAQDDLGPLRLLHGSYLQDWLSRPGDLNWRIDAELGGPSRTFADIGVHWCDLIEHVTGHRIASLVAHLSTAMPMRSSASEAASAPVTTEDAASLLFTTDHGATGSLIASQVTPGRKNRLWFSIDGAESSLVFDQEQPESLWVGSRDATTVVMRGAETMSPAARALSVLPAGHPQGYQDCFNAFVSDVYGAIVGNLEARMPTFRDGLRSSVLTEAVLASHSRRTWVVVDS